MKAWGQEIGLRTFAGVLLLVGVAVLSTLGFIVPDDKDLIIGVILGVIGAGAIASGGLKR